MAKKRLDSTLTSKKIFVSKTGIEIIDKKCRKCLEVKNPNQFYVATDYYLDKDGLQSVCKTCFNDIYDAAYIRERTINRAIMECCRTLNLRYHEAAVQSVLEQIKKAEDAGKNPRAPLSTYIQRMVVMCSRGQVIEDSEHHELTFFEVKPLLTEEDEALMSHDQFWGENFSTEHVEYLEQEYRQLLGGGASPDNYTETLLLKRICYKLLDIKKSQDSDSKKLGTLEKELLLLLKESALSPAHANAASSGKSIDTYGMWLVDVEKYSPAEWLKKEGRNMFHDVSDVDGYFQKYFVRPLKNFALGQPDYNIMDEGEDENGEQLSVEQ